MGKFMRIFLFILMIALTACKNTNIKESAKINTKANYIQDIDGSNKVVIIEEDKKIELLSRGRSKEIDFIVQSPLNLKPERVIVYNGKGVLRVNSSNEGLSFKEQNYVKFKDLANKDIKNLSILIKVNNEKYLCVNLNEKDVKNIERLFLDQG